MPRTIHVVPLVAALAAGTAADARAQGPKPTRLTLTWEVQERAIRAPQPDLKRWCDEQGEFLVGFWQGELRFWKLQLKDVAAGPVLVVGVQDAAGDLGFSLRVRGVSGAPAEGHLLASGTVPVRGTGLTEAAPDLKLRAVVAALRKAVDGQLEQKFRKSIPVADGVFLSPTNPQLLAVPLLLTDLGDDLHAQTSYRLACRRDMPPPPRFQDIVCTPIPPPDAPVDAKARGCVHVLASEGITGAIVIRAVYLK